MLGASDVPVICRENRPHSTSLGVFANAASECLSSRGTSPEHRPGALDRPGTPQDCSGLRPRQFDIRRRRESRGPALHAAPAPCRLSEVARCSCPRCLAESPASYTPGEVRAGSRIPIGLMELLPDPDRRRVITCPGEAGCRPAWAHGTGTPVGDPIEFEALRTVFDARPPRSSFCHIGSIKETSGIRPMLPGSWDLSRRPSFFT